MRQGPLTARLGIVISPALLDQLRCAADGAGKTVSEYVRAAIRAEIESESGK